MKYVNTLKHLSELTPDDIGIFVEAGEICHHLLSILSHSNVLEVSFTLKAIDYIAVMMGQDPYAATYNTSHDYFNAFAMMVRTFNGHLRGDRDVLLCQDELIDIGFVEVANL